MRHWSQLATRNWRARTARTLGAVLAITLGVAGVVWVTSSYESVRRTVLDWAIGYVGTSHITVQSPLGKYGAIPQRLIPALEKADGVKLANGVLVQRLRATLVDQRDLEQLNEDTLPWREDYGEIDLHGVNIDTELQVRNHAKALRRGRMLQPDDTFVCVIDESFAQEKNLKIGDAVFVWGGGRDKPFRLEVIGTVARKRIARLQKATALVPLATLQKINAKTGLITAVDVVLTDASAAKISAAFQKMRVAVRRIAPTATVSTVEGRMRQIEFAERQQSFVLLLLSCVVMMTALVTIFSTLSMGMIERIGQLGLLRCVGLTGGQLSWLMLLEILPIGILGIAAGIPLGIGMAALTAWLVPGYVGEFAISSNGVILAVAAGALTTLAAAIIPIIAAATVSPLEAARPRARQTGRWLLVAVLLCGLTVLAVQHFAVFDGLVRSARFFERAALAVVLLYVGYALLAAPLLKLFSAPAVGLAAGTLGVRWRLLQDQVGHAVWRSAGVCCGLMVGLSLIIEIFVVNQSVTAGWQFPTQFPEAYIWGHENYRGDAAEVAAGVPGVSAVTACVATNAIVQERRPLVFDQVQQSVTWLIGCDPDTFFDLVRVEMIEGELDDVRSKLSKGGYVVVADDFARSREKNVGDVVRVHVGPRSAQFTIAGVMASPALDIAAGYFQAHSEFLVVASGSVMASNADVERHFGISGRRLTLLNFDLPDEPPPPGWPPPRSTADPGDDLSEHVYDAKVSLAKRYQAHREGQVLREVRERLGVSQAFSGTAAELKNEIDSQMTEITRLLAAVPTVALIVAALGVANLMSANIAARARQIAVLRAVGATRGQILRMVIGEALVLGLLGSTLGVALGLHLAVNVVGMVDRMWGFRVALSMPWGSLALAVGFTLLLCLLAGLLPARHAARGNVVEALRTG